MGRIPFGVRKCGLAEGGENRRLLLFEAVWFSKGDLDIGTVDIIPLFPSQGYPESAEGCAEPE
jgi:hypothetical protein